jgi:hypothetical protein
MTEPLLIIASIVIAFIAGIIGGCFIGLSDSKTTSLFITSQKRIQKLKLIMKSEEV